MTDSFTINFARVTLIMQRLLDKIKITVKEGIFIKDPDSSELGKKILKGSIELIVECGFDTFTFKKLAKHIGSTEASVYRYFENKHKLLIYLNSWYWGWMEYRLVFQTANISNPREQLKKAIELVSEPVAEDQSIAHINEVKLQEIMINESNKAYFTKEVDRENKQGYFLTYKSLVARLAEIVLRINPDYPFANMLAATITEGALHQRFYSKHLPSLTNKKPKQDLIPEFYHQLALSAIENQQYGI